MKAAMRGVRGLVLASVACAMLAAVGGVRSMSIKCIPDGRSYGPHGISSGRCAVWWPNGRGFVGEWHDGVPHWGLMIWPGWACYMGGFRDGKPHGLEGVFITPDGRRYGPHGTPPEGCFANWPDGSFYVGEWHDGVPHGWGRMVWPGGALYEGGFRDGDPHGAGVFITPDGRRFEGGNMGRVMTLGIKAGGIAWSAGRPTAGDSAGYESRGMRGGE